MRLMLRDSSARHRFAQSTAAFRGDGWRMLRLRDTSLAVGLGDRISRPLTRRPADSGQC